MRTFAFGVSGDQFYIEFLIQTKLTDKQMEKILSESKDYQEFYSDGWWKNYSYLNIDDFPKRLLVPTTKNINGDGVITYDFILERISAKDKNETSLFYSGLSGVIFMGCISIFYWL